MVDPLFDLGGRVVLVTGASQGIGRETALTLARRGANIVLAARRAEPLEAAAAEVEATGAKAATVAGSVNDPGFAERAVAATLEVFDRLDVIVNNAACNHRVDLANPNWDHVREMWQVNVESPWRLAAAGHRHWAGHHSGVVINVASIAGFATVPPYNAYGTTKAALISLTHRLAQEFAPDIRVNAVAPGLVATERITTHAAATGMSLSDSIPLGRPGEPSDIANAVLFLASPASSWVTGHVLVVDGGTSGVGESVVGAGRRESISEG